jgi:hypothetical protein
LKEGNHQGCTVEVCGGFGGDGKGGTECNASSDD